MFVASIETDQQEVYRLTRPGGHTGVHPPFSLIGPLSACCESDNKDFLTEQWMNSLPENEKQALCRSIQILASSIFVLERDYSFIDYDYFNTKIAPGKYSRELFQEFLNQAERAWTELSSLVVAVETIESMILDSPPAGCYWYELGETDHNLILLKEALLLGESRGAQKVRINIVPE